MNGATSGSNLCAADRENRVSHVHKNGGAGNILPVLGYGKAHGGGCRGFGEVVRGIQTQGHRVFPGGDDLEGTALHVAAEILQHILVVAECQFDTGQPDAAAQPQGHFHFISGKRVGGIHVESVGGLPQILVDGGDLCILLNIV